MTNKFIPELKRGDWVRITHLPFKEKPYQRHRFRRCQHWRKTDMDINCVAEIFDITHHFGKVFTLKYLCICKRAFEERVHATDLFEILPKSEVAMQKLRK